MVSGHGVVPPMAQEGNLAENFRRWSQRLKIHLTANDLDNASDKRKIAILLNCIGEKGILVYNSFNITEEDVKFDNVIKKFEEYFSPRKNLTILRNDFFTMKQDGGERLEDYFTKVENLGLACEFGALREKLIVSKIIAGLESKYNDIKAKLLSEEEDKLTSKYVKEYLQTCETSRLYVEKEYKENSESSTLNQPVITRSGRTVKIPEKLNL